MHPCIVCSLYTYTSMVRVLQGSITITLHWLGNRGTLISIGYVCYKPTTQFEEFQQLRYTLCIDELIFVSPVIGVIHSVSYFIIVRDSFS